MTTTRLAILSFVLVCGTAAYADTFGTGANQFTLDFVTIPGSTNPTPAQTTAVNLDGFGIVEYSG